MNCIDTPVALNALIGVSLVIAGVNLMSQLDPIARGYGSYCFAFGFLLLGVSASGGQVLKMNLRNNQHLLSIGSAVAVIAGTFLMYYHVANSLKNAMKSDLAAYPNFRNDILNSIPIINHVLIYGGYAGLILASSLRKDNSVNMVKLALLVGSFAVVSWTHRQMLHEQIHGHDSQKYRIAHLLSFGLVVLSVAYKC